MDLAGCAPSVPYATIRDIVAEELGKPVDAVFESIDPVPLASASVAQVHAAVLRGSRKNVVIKVLKPDVTDVLAADLSFIYIASRVLTFLNPELSRLSLAEIVGDIRSSMMDEVDFNKEASNIVAFQNYLEAAGITNVAQLPALTDAQLKAAGIKIVGHRKRLLTAAKAFGGA